MPSRSPQRCLCSASASLDSASRAASSNRFDISTEQRWALSVGRINVDKLYRWRHESDDGCSQHVVFAAIATAGTLYACAVGWEACCRKRGLDEGFSAISSSDRRDG